MKTFVQYMEDAWGNHEQDHTLLDQIISKLVSLQEDIHQLVEKLSHGDDPVNHAMDHFIRSFSVLQATLKTSVIKNTNNPERID